MAEYIDKDRLRLMKTEECAGHTIEYAMGWKACVEWVKSLPTADVRPVVRGEWVEHTYILYDGKPGYSIECTACHEEFTEVNLREKPSKTNFCPYCGAMMGGADG